MKTKLLILFLLAASIAQSQNLLQNPGFEQFTGNIPNFWIVTYGSSQNEVTNKNEGLSSLKGFPESPMPSFTPNFWISQDFTLSDVETYTLKFDYYIPGTISTNNISRIGFELELDNSADAFFFPNYPTITPVFGAWKTVEFDFKIHAFRAPALSAVIKLTLQIGSDAGFTGTNALFDNVIIAKKATLGALDFEKQTNPISYISKDEVKLNSDFKNSSYVIYSLNGTVMKKAKNNSSEIIGISELSKGIYLLKLSDFSTSIKFIKE